MKAAAGAELTPLSWRSPKTTVRDSPIHGRGLFATAGFARDEVVCVKGGHIITGDRLVAINAELGPVEIQIDEDLFIAPVTAEEREGSMLYTNHSCEPNLGVRGNITFVAMRDVTAGEELTHDWCMTDDAGYHVRCTCGSPGCRTYLTGNDWERRELQTRYRGYFSSYLARRF